MADYKYSLRATAQNASASALAAVTPSDSTDLPGGLARGLFVGVAGSLVVQDRAGNTVELVSAGSQYHPVRVVRVLATGTTAGSIIALY